MEDPTSSRTVQTCTCLLCGDSSTYILNPQGNRVFIKEEESIISGTSHSMASAEQQGPNFSWEIEVFDFFVSYTKMLYKGKNSEWKSHWNLINEPAPLCGNCKETIKDLKQRYEEIQKLEKLLGDKMKIFKESILESEERFGGDLYLADERYFWSRAKLLGEGVVRKAHPESELPGTKGRRQSPAKKRKFIGIEDQNQLNISHEEVKVEELPMSVLSDPDNDNIGKNEDIPEPEPGSFGDAQASDAAMAKSVHEAEFSTSFPVPKPRIRSRGTNSGLKRETQKLVAESINTYDSISSQGRPKRAAAAKANLRDDFDPETLMLHDFEDEEDPTPKKKTVDRDDWKFLDEKEKKVCKIKKEREVFYFHKYTTTYEEETGQYRYLNIYFDVIDEKTFKCTECNKLFTRTRTIGDTGRQRLKLHAVRSHLTRKCPWQYCDFVGKTRGKTEVHFMKTHDKIYSKRFACDICGMPCSRPSAIKIHRMTHCNEEEKNEALLRGEMSIAKVNNKSKTQKCPKCDITIQSVNLKAHLKICGRSKQSHLCAQCGKSCSSALSLNHHMKRVHPNPMEWGQLPFACIYCDRRFVRENELKAHKVSHTGEYPYPCTLCEKMFNSKYNLDRHMKLHTNERSFQCEKCPTAFVSSHALRRHFDHYHAEGSNPKRPSFIKDPNRGRFGKRWTTKKTGDAAAIKDNGTQETESQQSYTSASAEFMS